MDDTVPASEFGVSPLAACARHLDFVRFLHELNATLARRYGVGLPSDDINYGAGPTGGLDDVDDIYSGRSGANPAADKGKVRKTYHGGVRPDHMCFDSIAREKALAQKPAICCPNCHNPVKELDSAQPKYVKPEGVTEEPPMHFVLHPCCCKVHPEWAAAFTKELNRRMEGEVPLPVCAFKPEELDAKVRALEEQITDIMAQREDAEGAARKRLEYYLIIAVDELMRLLPGAHNRLPQVDQLDPEVESWASKNKMSKPPVKKSSEFGYPPGYKNPLQKADASQAGSVNVMGAGPLSGSAGEASLFAKEEAMHVDPAVAAAGKEQLKKQRTAAQIVKLGGMLSRRTLSEVFNIDISAEQEALAKELAQQAKVGTMSGLGHDNPALYPGLQTKPIGPAPAGVGSDPQSVPWDKSMLAAAREFMDRHNMLVLQLINEQILQQPHHDTRTASAWLVSMKRSIDGYMQLGTAIGKEAKQLLAVIIPVLLPAAGLVPTKTRPATELPLPVSAHELKADFHDGFAPAKRRIVKKPSEGEGSPA